MANGLLRATRSRVGVDAAARYSGAHMSVCGREGFCQFGWYREFYSSQAFIYAWDFLFFGGDHVYLIKAMAAHRLTQESISIYTNEQEIKL